MVTGVVFGLLTLFYCSRNAPNRIEEGQHNWPEIAAITPAVSILGSALSFLLVFRLSWAFGRWNDARSLLGAQAARLRSLCILFHAQRGPA